MSDPTESEIDKLLRLAGKDTRGPSKEVFERVMARVTDIASVDTFSSGERVPQSLRRGPTQASLLKRVFLAKSMQLGLAAAAGLGAGIPLGERLEQNREPMALASPHEIAPHLPDARPRSAQITSAHVIAIEGPRETAPPENGAASKKDIQPTPSIEADELVAEEAQIRIARTAIERRNFEAGKQAVERHAARYPNGQLSEEREALYVVALVGLGQRQSARERASLFKSRYPNSLLRKVVDDAIAQSP